MATVTGPFSLAPNPSNEMLGRGKIYFDRFVNNTTNRQGQQDLGNCTNFEIENATEVKEKYESMDPASSLYARAVTRQTVKLKITGDEYSLDNLKNALLGDLEVITAAGATVVGETITPATGSVLGRYYDLANRNITALTNVKQGATVLVLGTDYTADLVKGRIYLLTTSVTITPGAALTSDYTFGTYTFNAIKVATIGLVEGYVRFIGLPVKGPTYEAEFWYVSFTPSGQLGFIADDFGNWTLEGQCIADPVRHPTEPIGRIIQVA